MDPGNDTENKYLLDDIQNDTDSKSSTQKKYQLYEICGYETPNPKTEYQQAGM